MYSVLNLVISIKSYMKPYELIRSIFKLKLIYSKLYTGWSG